MPASAPPPPVSPETVGLARTHVRDLLSSSEAFRALPAETQKQIAGDTVRVASYLAEPEGIRAAATPVPGAPPLAGSTSARALDDTSKPPAQGEFRAQGAREGVAVAGALLAAVDFPTFISSLVKGVFHAIVESSIEQMEAYGKLVADVAKSLNEFRDENVSENQGRDHLVDQFPDLFDIDTGGEEGPRVRLREGVDEQTGLTRIQSLPTNGKVTSLDDDSIEGQLVPAARTQLASGRQQLLATMVMMGINRIVVTEGKIQAKVLYDFQARDNFKFNQSATQFDYGDQVRTTQQGDEEVDRQDAGSTRSRAADGSTQREDRGGSYYAKGRYKNTSEPVLKLVSASTETTDASLTTKASLAGVVDINFKSDYFPLDKLANAGQIAQIQQAATPTAPGSPVGTPASPPAQGATR